jgi:hypothetical protein
MPSQLPTDDEAYTPKGVGIAPSPHAFHEAFRQLPRARGLTLARAAREAGVALWQMMDYTRQKKIAAQYEIEDFERDIRSVRITDSSVKSVADSSCHGFHGFH